MNRARFLTLFVLMVIASASIAPAADATKITGSTLWGADDLKWVPMPGVAGAQQVTLWGDPTKGAHRIFYKWPAGTVVPPHTHTHGDRGVVISGTMTITDIDGKPRKLPAGSYFSLAGGTKHATTCEPGDACVFFIEREGAFDAHMERSAGTRGK